MWAEEENFSPFNSEVCATTSVSHLCSSVWVYLTLPMMKPKETSEWLIYAQLEPSLLFSDFISRWCSCKKTSTQQLYPSSISRLKPIKRIMQIIWKCALVMCHIQTIAVWSWVFLWVRSWSSAIVSRFFFFLKADSFKLDSHNISFGFCSSLSDRKASGCEDDSWLSRSRNGASWRAEQLVNDASVRSVI